MTSLMRRSLCTAIAVTGAVLVGCGGSGETPSAPASDLRLTSPDFEGGQPIPAEFTADGANRSPALKWSDAPDGTKCFVLTCIDPDAPAGPWVHWVAYAIGPSLDSLPAGVPPVAHHDESGVRQGVNSFGNLGYGGPDPPPGKVHHYVFTLYAVGATPTLPEKASKEAVVGAITPHVLAEATLTGTYERE